jgi:predicted short-subunit dehydrogenase-like oxidoreductase (DUF2520 family)
MISASDSEIDSIAHRLAQLHSVGEGQIIYHCSGAIESSVLCHLRLKGVSVAGVHPIRSFAEPSTAYESFPGTYCAMEGDADAKQALRVLYESIGAEVFEIAPLMKLVCHAGHVFASNYVVAVLDIARSLYRVAGIPDDVSRRFMDGIVRGTVANVSALGVERALTGPVVRGEVSVVHDQLNRLAELSSPWHECDAVALYAKLGEVALSIAQRRGELDVATLDALRALLVAHGATDKKKGAEPATRLPVAS